MRTVWGARSRAVELPVLRHEVVVLRRVAEETTPRRRSEFSTGTCCSSREPSLDDLGDDDPPGEIDCGRIALDHVDAVADGGVERDAAS